MTHIVEQKTSELTSHYWLMSQTIDIKKLVDHVRIQFAESSLYKCPRSREKYMGKPHDE
jgi:hypothetical protein